MADEGPEDEVIASIWAGESKPRLFAVKIGEVHHSVAEPIVWFPFIVIVVVGWIGLVAVLPPDLAGEFIDITFGWTAILSGDLSTEVLISLAVDIVGLVLVFVLYTWVYGTVINWLLAKSEA